MKKKVISFLLALLIIPTFLSHASFAEYVDNNSGDGCYYYNNHRYQVFEASMDWNEAKAYCESLGGYLISINDKEEQSFVNSVISNYSKNLYWVGLYLTSEKEWYWTDGTIMNYTNWGSGEPNADFNGKECVTEIYGKNYQQFHLGEWNDSLISGGTMEYWKLYNTGFICEWDDNNSGAVDFVVESKAAALDRSLYTEDSLAAVNAAVGEGKFEARQAEVDTMAAAINAALDSLEYKELGIANNTGMFKAVTAHLEKADGKTTLVMALSGTGYKNLFKGTYEQAVVNGDHTENWIVGYTNDDGRLEFRIPVADGETYIPLVAVSQGYYDKYLNGQNSLERAFYPRQAEVNEEAKTLVTGDYEFSQNIRVTNNVKMLKVNGATLDTVGGPNSNNYKADLILTMESDSYDAAYVGNYAEASEATAAIALEEGNIFTIPVKWVETFGKPESLVNLANGEPFYLSLKSKKNGTWYEYIATLDEAAGTMVLDSSEADYIEVEEPNAEISVTPKSISVNEDHAAVTVTFKIPTPDKEYLTEYLNGVSYRFFVSPNALNPVPVDVPDGLEDITELVMPDNSWQIITRSISDDGMSASMTVPFYPPKTASYTIYPTFISKNGRQIQTQVEVFSPQSAYGIDYSYTPENLSKQDKEVQVYLQECYDNFIHAYDNYKDSVTLDIQEEGKKNGGNYSESFKKQAERMMEKDTSHKQLQINFGAERHALLAYTALCRMIYEIGEKKGVDFSSVNFQDVLSSSTKIVTQIAGAISSYERSFSDIEQGHEIAINHFGFGMAGYTSIYRDGALIAYVSDYESAAAGVSAFLGELKTLNSNAINNVYYAAIRDVTGLSITKLTQNAVDKGLNRIASKLSQMGHPHLISNIKTCYGYYSHCKSLLERGFTPTTLNTKAKEINTLVGWSNSYKVVQDSMSSKAAGKLVEAYNKFSAAIREWYTTKDVSEAHRLGNCIKAMFSCPVAIRVFSEDGRPLGYVGEDETWFDDSIYITENCEAKIIYSPNNLKLSYQIVGTDSGKVTCSFEEVVDGTPFGRVNYYDYPVEQGAEIEASLKTGQISGLDDVVMTGKEGVIEADKYISAADDNASVVISTNQISEDAGVVYGGGRYPKGDPVVLSASANEGHHFSAWFDENGNLLGTNSYLEFAAQADLAVFAVFSNDLMGIQLDKEQLNMVPDETYTLVPSFNPENATNQYVSWESSNPSVVSVDSMGQVKAIGEGEAIITAVSQEDESIKVQCRVIVNRSEAPAFVKGDVNCDSKVDSKDLTTLAKHVARITQITDSGLLAAADVNADDKIDSKDLTHLAKYVAKIIPEL